MSRRKELLRPALRLGEPPSNHESMLRFVLRAGGLVLLAGAFSLFVTDATRAIAAGAPVFTSIGVALAWASSVASDRLRVALEGLHPLLWDPLATLFLQLPAFLPLAAVALLCLFLGARRSVDADA